MNGYGKIGALPGPSLRLSAALCAALAQLSAVGCSSGTQDLGVSGANPPRDDESNEPQGESVPVETDGAKTPPDVALSVGTASPSSTPPTGASTAGTDTTDQANSAPALPIALDSAPANYRVVRLTHSQWENSVRQLLRLDAPTGFADSFTPDPLVSTFDNDEANLEVGSNLEADYAAAAEALATQVTQDAEQLARIEPSTDSTTFVRSFGRRAFRRSLTSDEETRYMDLFDQGVVLSSETNFSSGAALVIEAMLQAPQFLYRTELGDDAAALNGFEVASKLAFALWNTAPDVDWLDRAEQGEFDTEDGVRAVASEALDTTQAVEQMRHYQAQLLHLPRLANIEKAADVEYDSMLNPSLQTTAELFFDNLFTSGLGVKDIFGSTRAYVDPLLAKLYGIEGVTDGWAEVDLGASRPGYFTQLPFLILHSVNLTPDAIHRGAELQDRILCGKLMAPFAGLQLPARMEGDTNRQYIANLTENGECAGCHAAYINPLGFAFENFDGMGQVRETDNGQPVNTEGSYPFTEGTQTFADASELMGILASAAQTHECYVKHLGEFLLARTLSNADEDTTTLKAFAEDSLSGDSIKQLILDWVSSPSFRTRIGAEG